MDCARKIKKFLEGKGEERFKIFVRLQMQLDVFIFSEKNEAIHYYDEFVKERGIPENYKISFEVVSPEEEQNDPYYASIVADLDNKIDHGPRYRLNSLLSLTSARDVLKDLPPIVTFYSYKGGMGRTTTLVSYAMDLAYNHKKNVVIIDCDLEAPGYLNFFSLYKHEDLKAAKKNGFVEFICDSKFSGESIDLANYLIELPKGDDDCNYWLKPGDGNIWIMPAGNLNESCLDENIIGPNIDENDLWHHRSDYLEGLGKLNSIDPQSLKNAFLKIFKRLTENNSINPDIILVDSRTGFNDIFGTLAFSLSSCVVGFFGRSRQTEPGFIDLLTSHLKQNTELDKDAPLKLQLVYSILPDGLNGGSSRMNDLMGHLYNSNRPDESSLHRQELLERIGGEDENADEEYKKEIRSLSPSSKLSDYYQIFDNINRDVFAKEYDTDEPTTTSDARTIILRHLKGVLDGVTDFAEDAKIEPSRFFFRSCMKDLFLPDKFIIQGYKGTGKTCLYRALANKEISQKMVEWAQSDKSYERLFLQILPEGDDEYPFKSIDVSKITNTDVYFRNLWMFITWNNLLYDDGNDDLKSIRKRIREDSPLKECIRRVSGAETRVLLNKILEQGDIALSAIQHDLRKLDEELVKEGKCLFILYDRLDSFIPAWIWNEVVSPLIEFLRDSHSKYKNIVPKIFIRTDLYKQTEGVNTGRLAKNIISIEWSIAEVFAYFFKLIFSAPQIGILFWDFAKQLGMNQQYIDSIKKNFDENFNQFKSLNEAEMTPVVQTFFGKDVVYDNKSYGKPWIFFVNELANADQNSISLRPFVNLLKCSLGKVDLENAEASHSEILNSSIYASDDVRFDAASMYFDDIVKDPTAVDLKHLKDVVNEQRKYQFKSLHADLFNDLITEVYGRIQNKGVRSVVESTDKLKALIFANGIMAKKETTRGTFYSFAPIYWFPWKLRDSFAEKENAKVQEPSLSKSEITERLVGVLMLNQKQKPVISVTINQGNEQREFHYAVFGKIPADCEIGDLVSFNINETPNKKKPNSVYRVAADLRKVSQDVLNEKSSTKVVLKEWAISRGIKVKTVCNTLRSIGVNVENADSKVYLDVLTSIEKKLLDEKRKKMEKRKHQRRLRKKAKLQENFSDTKSTDSPNQENSADDVSTQKKDTEGDLWSGLKKFFTTYF